MKKFGLILLLSLPLGCAPSESTTPPSTPTDSNATSAAVEQPNVSDDATTTKVVIAVPNMH